MKILLNEYRVLEMLWKYFLLLKKSCVSISWTYRKHNIYYVNYIFSMSSKNEDKLSKAIKTILEQAETRGDVLLSSIPVRVITLPVDWIRFVNWDLFRMFNRFITSPPVTPSNPICIACIFASNG
ncbi:hypothetical protein ABH899_003640 [Paenibacillus sp. RC84]